MNWFEVEIFSGKKEGVSKKVYKEGIYKLNELFPVNADLTICYLDGRLFIKGYMKNITEDKELDNWQEIDPQALIKVDHLILNIKLGGIENEQDLSNRQQY